MFSAVATTEVPTLPVLLLVDAHPSCTSATSCSRQLDLSFLGPLCLPTMLDPLSVCLRVPCLSLLCLLRA